MSKSTCCQSITWVQITKERTLLRRLMRRAVIVLFLLQTRSTNGFGTKWVGRHFSWNENARDLAEGVKHDLSLVDNNNLDWFGVCTSDTGKEYHKPTQYMDMNDTSISGFVFPESEVQARAIESDAPAVLLKSGPGTGKTYVLASRIAFLLTNSICRPEQMVLLSFTNRDANTIKGQALQTMFKDSNETHWGLSSDDMSQRLWCGTVHAFAKNIVLAYSPNVARFRVLSSKESKQRVDKCLRDSLQPRNYRGQSRNKKLQSIRLLYRDALHETTQARSLVVHQMLRCFELWKECGMSRPPRVGGIKVQSPDRSTIQKENSVELAVRLGMFPKVASLAWTLFPLYQQYHESANTADPADLAPLAYHLLSSRPGKLSEMRSKLRHIILDEYQDVSVAQYRLVRLVALGSHGKEGGRSTTARALSHLPPVLLSIIDKDDTRESDAFTIPKLFCAGDPNQSIYGWRGAAPSLSVNGFRKDYPQGIVVSLDTNFRIPSSTWNTLGRLSGQTVATVAKPRTFMQSPLSAQQARTMLTDAIANRTSPVDLKMLSQEGSETLPPTMYINGCWDAREELKWTARKIVARSKEKLRRCASALKRVDGVGVDPNIVDPSDVAILVRSMTQIGLVREVLEQSSIPYAVIDSNPNAATQSSRPMKPVTIMTMHRAKGEEFDDVYLHGWTEGIFPHPSAVSINRIEEERRLAYVAISRARQQVEITHSYVQRKVHAGPNLEWRNVTELVKPSRFLYELVPGAQNQRTAVVRAEPRDDSQPTVIWNRGRGSKETFMGSNMPDGFRKSYMAPKGFAVVGDVHAKRMETAIQALDAVGSEDGETAQFDKMQCSTISTTAQQSKQCDHNLDTGLVVQVARGLTDVLSGGRGAKQKVKKEFLRVLKESFGFGRGSVPLFRCESEVQQWEMANTSMVDNLSFELVLSRALSRCTALQLGLFIVHLERDRDNELMEGGTR